MNSNRLIYLYKYTCHENGKSYIGVTSDPIQRFRRHKHASSGVVAFNRAVRKYGIDNFNFQILAIFDDVNAANYHENAAIKAFGTLAPGGYNLAGGSPKTKYFGPLSDETKEKIGNGNRGKIHSRGAIEIMAASKRGKPSWNKGKKFSIETRLKMSLAHEGKPLSQQHREHMINALRRQDIRSKISISLMGKPLSKEHRDAISQGNKGKIRTPEQRLRYSEARKAFLTREVENVR